MVHDDSMKISPPLSTPLPPLPSLTDQLLRHRKAVTDLLCKFYATHLSFTCVLIVTSLALSIRTRHIS